IQRYLADEPVLAGPPSAGYRLRKFVRRNQGPVLAVCLIILALVGGIVGTSLGLIRAKQARDAEAERAEGERQAKLKALAAAQAEKTAKDTAKEREAETQAVLDFVQNKVFAAARPKSQDGGLGGKVSLRGAIEAALPFVHKSFRDQPLVEAKLRMTMGASYFYLSEPKLAAEQFLEARSIRSSHLGPDHPATLASMNNLANCYAALGLNAEALKLQEETLALRKAKLGPDHPETLISMNNLAHTYAAVGRHTDALELRERTLELRRAKLGPEDPDTLMSMYNLAKSYAELGRHDSALKLREQTLELRKAKLGPDHPDTFESM